MTATAAPKNKPTLGAIRRADDDGGQLLTELEGFLRRYVAFPKPHQAAVVAAWILHTHCYQSFESTPRLAVVAPEKQSGKTRLLECLDVLTQQPLHCSNISPAALFRVIDGEPSTILLDEADAVFATRGDGREELRSLLNAGHRRGAEVVRIVGDDWPARMRDACTSVVAESGANPQSIGIRLLSDIQAIFDADGHGRVTSAELVRRLVSDETAPWSDMRGNPLTPQRLAGLLRPYDLRPRNIKFGQSTLKGYDAVDFADAFARYLPSTRPPSPKPLPATDGRVATPKP